jgi:hypothetical protein
VHGIKDIVHIYLICKSWYILQSVPLDDIPPNILAFLNEWGDDKKL